MTVDEMIAEVAAFFDRQDMVTLLRTHFPKALRTAHSYQKFTKDLGTIYLPDPVIVNGRVYLTTAVLPQLQTLLEIKGYADYTSSVIGAETLYYPGNSDGVTYHNLNEGYAAKDYYGFTYDSGYTMLGQNITVKGVPGTCKLFEVLAVLWPTFTYNAFSDTYTTNSWIMQEYPKLIQQLLMIQGATISQQSDVLATARSELGQIREDFLNSFTGDMYGGQRIGSN